MWTLVSWHLDDSQQVVQWMPAHTAQTSIGQKHCSDGEVVDEHKWCANQLVDLLAKQAAEDIRVPAESRHTIICQEIQLTELAVFLGKLTFAANNHELPDGTALTKGTLLFLALGLAGMTETLRGLERTASG